MSNSIEKKRAGKTPKLSLRQQKERRRFLQASVAATGCVAAISVIGFVPVRGKWRPRVRPPGALDEVPFLAACIKCGQCVQVCPVEAIELADLAEGFGVGVPYIETRDQACDFSCDGLQCVLACPTGALTHEINYPHQVRIGLAELARPERCLARNGEGFKGQARGPQFPGLLRYEEIDRWNPIPVRDHPYDLELCDLCVRQCPIEIRIAQCEAGTPPSGDENQCPPKRAIELAPMEANGGGLRKTPVVSDGCVGCGVCEMVCPPEPPAIVINRQKKAAPAA